MQKTTHKQSRKWLNRLKVGEKIALGYALSIGVAIAGTATGIIVGNQYQDSALETQVHIEEEVEILSLLQRGVLQTRTHQQQLIPLSAFPEDFQDEYSHILKHAETIEEAWHRIEQRIHQHEETEHHAEDKDDEFSGFLTTYDGVANQYLTELDKLVTDINPASLNTPAKVQAAQERILAFTNSDLAIAFDGISDDLSTLIADSKAEYQDALAQAAIANRLRNQLILVSMGLSLVIAALLATLISRAINRPLKALEETAAKVVSSEDFTVRAEVVSTDEIGGLTTALNQLIEWVGNRTQALEEAKETLEGRVKDRTQELNAIIDNLGNGLLVVNPAGTIIHANPTLKRMFNLSDSDLAGKAVEAIFDDRIIQIVKHSQANMTAAWNTELALESEQIGQATITPILSAENASANNTAATVVGTVVLIRDITTEKAVDQMKTDFISTVSHELRTPLTSVLGFAKIIKKKLETVLLPAVVSEEKKTKRAVRQVQDNLQIIISEGERLTSLINDVLDIAKIEAGKIEWRMTEVSPQTIVEQAIAATSVLAQKNNIVVITDIAPTLPTVTADPDRLMQVIINLISNAIKFTQDGNVVCEVKPTEDELRISIIDTGIGISAEDQPLVFEKFKQVGEIMTDKPQGTGLGLPICKQIVEHHGGRIWVESQLGVGSTFSVALPLNSSLAKPIVNNQTVEDLVKRLKADVKQTTPSTSGEIKTILVVDDESNIRSLLRQELETEGYLVQEAKDGVAALESIKQTPPDLIITDVMMPRLDGFDLTAVLKTNPETADIPTVILSIVEDKDRGFQLGVDRYLTKPIDVGSLLSNVETLLTHKTSRSKVLVVNKDACASKTLTEVLLTKGYVVAEASTGQEGLDKARAIKPDMMIVDAELLEENNIVKTLRFEKGLENVSVILVENAHPTDAIIENDVEKQDVEKTDAKN
ncbi:MAG: ATP-binding protein [Cyanobacteria bacterium J06634_6]